MGKNKILKTFYFGQNNMGNHCGEGGVKNPLKSVHVVYEKSLAIWHLAKICEFWTYSRVSPYFEGCGIEVYFTVSMKEWLWIVIVFTSMSENSIHVVNPCRISSPNLLSNVSEDRMWEWAADFLHIKLTIPTAREAHSDSSSEKLKYLKNKHLLHRSQLLQKKIGNFAKTCYFAFMPLRFKV